MTKQNNNVLTNEKRAEIEEFLNSQEAKSVLMSGKDTWLSLRIFDNVIIEVQPNEVLVTNKKTKNVIESYNSIERALDEDRIFKVLENDSHGNRVVIDNDRKVLINGEIYDVDFIGIWTDGNTLIAIDKSEETLYVIHINNDGEFIDETEMLIAGFSEFTNRCCVPNVYKPVDRWEVYSKVAEHIENNYVSVLSKALEEGISDDVTHRIYKDTVRVLLDALQLEARYIYFTGLVSRIYNMRRRDLMVNAFITFKGAYVIITRVGAVTKLVKVKVPDINMTTIIDGDIITQFFNVIEDNL